MINMNKVMFNVQYSYPKMKYMGEFFDVKTELVRNSSKEALKDIELGKRAAVQKALNTLSKNVLGSREVVNGTSVKEGILPEKAVRMLKETLFVVDGIEVKVSPGVYGPVNVMQKMPRGNVTNLKKVDMSGGNTWFTIRNAMQTYDGEPFSLALCDVEMRSGFALVAVDSLEGIKGKGELMVTYFDSEGYYIDLAKKYINTKGIVRG